MFLMKSADLSSTLTTKTLVEAGVSWPSLVDKIRNREKWKEVIPTTTNTMNYGLSDSRRKVTIS